MFVRDHVNEVVAATLAKAGISVVQRLSESDPTALGLLPNCTAAVAHTIEDLGDAVDADVECTTIGDAKSMS